MLQHVRLAKRPSDQMTMRLWKLGPRSEMFLASNFNTVPVQVTTETLPDLQYQPADTTTECRFTVFDFQIHVANLHVIEGIPTCIHLAQPVEDG